MIIKVRITKNYGIQAVYPVCETAQKLARLAGTKTLTPNIIKSIKDLGYELQVEQESL